MKNGRILKMMSVGMLAVCSSVFATGCSIDGLLTNAWFGFGAGLGGIPAQIVGNFLVGVLGLGTGQNVGA